MGKEIEKTDSRISMRALGMTHLCHFPGLGRREEWATGRVWFVRAKKQEFAPFAQERERERARIPIFILLLPIGNDKYTIPTRFYLFTSYKQATTLSG